jgi:hypothetical protein
VANKFVQSVRLSGRNIPRKNTSILINLLLENFTKKLSSDFNFQSEGINLTNNLRYGTDDPDIILSSRQSLHTEANASPVSAEDPTTK